MTKYQELKESERMKTKLDDTKMRRVQILGLILALFLVLVPGTATPALAQPELVFVGSVGIAPVPGHDGLMIVEFLDIKRSPVGRADALTLSTMAEEPVAAVTDNEEFAFFLEAMGFPVVVVEDEELEVWMEGRTMYAELTVSAGPLHPIYAEFKGCYGKPIKGEESGPMPGGAWMTMTYIGYEAVVYFMHDSVVCGPIPGIVCPQFLLKVTPP